MSKGKQSKDGISWTTNPMDEKGASVSALRPGEIIALSRQHSPPDQKVVVNIWFQQQDLKSWNPTLISAAGKPIVITLGKRLTSDQRYSDADSTLQVGEASKPIKDVKRDQRDDAVEVGFAVFNDMQSLLPNELWFPVPITPHDKRTGALVTVTIGDKEEKSSELKVELLTRQMTWRQKMEQFLAWQDQLFYASPRAISYDKTGKYYSSMNWEPPAIEWPPKEKKDKKGNVIPPKKDKDGNEIKPIRPPTLYHANASGFGLRTPCYVCSPFANAFMTYWFNYHDTNKGLIATGGQSAEMLIAAHSSLMVGEDMLPPPTSGPAKDSTVAELNALAVTARTGTYRLTDGGELVQGLTGSPKKKTSKKKDLKVKAGAVVAWTSNAWRYHGGDGWTNETLYTVMSSAPTGSIYVCANEHHVWLMMRLGGEHTVEKKALVGGSGDCEPGVYKIEANTAIPVQFGYQLYLKEAYLKETKQEKKPPFKAKELEALKAALDEIKDIPDGPATREYAISRKTVHDNLLLAYDKVKGDSKLDGMWAFAGTDLTMCNAKLEKNAKGELIFHRGEAAPEAFREANVPTKPFRVWQVKSIIHNKTGWIDAGHAEAQDPEVKKLFHHDCRPITSEGT